MIGTFGGDVKLCAWNTNKDLLALAFKDSVAVFRMAPAGSMVRTLPGLFCCLISNFYVKYLDLI